MVLWYRKLEAEDKQSKVSLGGQSLYQQAAWNSRGATTVMVISCWLLLADYRISWAVTLVSAVAPLTKILIDVLILSP